MPAVGLEVDLALDSLGDTVGSQGLPCCLHLVGSERALEIFCLGMAGSAVDPWN